MLFRSRLAEHYGVFSHLCRQINDICPKLILWNLRNGWNNTHAGIYKTIDAISLMPINKTMPWWILPEAMLALLLAYRQTQNNEFLHKYMLVNNTYINNYLNPITDFGPYQNLDAETGKPVNIIPACKFQDPEFHSGKNILSCAQLIALLPH